MMTTEQTAKYNELIENAIPNTSKGVSDDVYKRQVSMAAYRIVNGGKVDRTDAKILGIPMTYDYASKVLDNACPRCGGAGVGNWGAVRNGVCYRCGGSGKR